MLIKRTERQARHGSLAAALATHSGGHLDRRTSDQDRRVQVIRLTKAGRAEFRKMAAEHEIWIADMFSDLAEKDVRDLMRLLAKTKLSAR